MGKVEEGRSKEDSFCVVFFLVGFLVVVFFGGVFLYGPSSKDQAGLELDICLFLPPKGGYHQYPTYFFFLRKPF